MHPRARLVISFVLALVLTIPTVIGGAAAPPTPIERSRDFAAGERCAFPLRIAVSGKLNHLALPDGSTIDTGPRLQATLTNLANPEKSLRLNITGALHSSTLPNGNTEFTFTGRNLLFVPSTRELLLIRGHFTLVFAATGAVVQPLSGKGKTTDVCVLLA